jgi:hypothetical protein
MKPKETLLRLTLCATACAAALSLAACRSAPSQASVMPASQTALGNAFRVKLPAGTQLILPTPRDAEEIRAIAINEIDLGQSTGRTVTLARPLQLVSPAYIAQRNQGELALQTLVQDLKNENARLRAK